MGTPLNNTKHRHLRYQTRVFLQPYWLPKIPNVGVWNTFKKHLKSLLLVFGIPMRKQREHPYPYTNAKHQHFI
jgi:hypothetical protein